MSQLDLSGKRPKNAPHSSSPGDFLVSQSVPPGSDEARRMTAGSGRRCYELCGNSDPLGLLEKMLLESSDWHSMMSLLIWRIRNTCAGHSIFQLSRWERGTSASGSSLLPTPDTLAGSATANLQCNRIYPKNLTQAARDGYTPKILPTPRASESDQGPTNREKIAAAGSSWMGQHRGATLSTIVKLWPTPTSRDHKDTGNAIILGSVEVNCLLGRAVGPSKESGSLSPDWTEWLQGLPIGWTDCGASVTRLSHNKSTQSLKPLRKSKKERTNDRKIGKELS